MAWPFSRPLCRLAPTTLEHFPPFTGRSFLAPCSRREKLPLLCKSTFLKLKSEGLIDFAEERLSVVLRNDFYVN